MDEEESLSTDGEDSEEAVCLIRAHERVHAWDFVQEDEETKRTMRQLNTLPPKRF